MSVICLQLAHIILNCLEVISLWFSLTAVVVAAAVLRLGVRTLVDLVAAVLLPAAMTEFVVLCGGEAQHRPTTYF